MPRLFRVIVPVTDIEIAKQFYGSIFGQEGRRVSPGRHYFDCRGTIIACYDPSADGDDYHPTPLPEPLYFAVEDLEAVFDKAKAAGAHFPSTDVPGIGPFGEIATRPWGERSFYANDPFGNPLCFVSRDTVFTG